MTYSTEEIDFQTEIAVAGETFIDYYENPLQGKLVMEAVGTQISVVEQTNPFEVSFIFTLYSG